MQTTPLTLAQRASVGSTEAAKDVVARFGVVGPKRATHLVFRIRPVKRTCEHRAIDLVAALPDLLRRLPSQPADQLDELLPDVWFASYPRARRKGAA
jgi:hypothetical protein